MRDLLARLAPALGGLQLAKDLRLAGWLEASVGNLKWARNVALGMATWLTLPKSHWNQARPTLCPTSEATSEATFWLRLIFCVTSWTESSSWRIRKPARAL